jgi:hypothetical protein
MQDPTDGLWWALRNPLLNYLRFGFLIFVMEQLVVSKSHEQAADLRSVFCFGKTITALSRLVIA